MRLSLRHFLHIPILLIWCCLACSQSYAQFKPETLQQIESLLQEKESRTPAQQKIDCHLLQALRERRGEKMAPGTNLEPSRVLAAGNGNIKVDISAIVTDQLLAKIESIGGKIIYPSWKYNTIRAIVNFSMIETISAYPEIHFVEPAVEASTVGSELSQTSITNHSTAIQSKLIYYMLVHRNTPLQVPLTGSITSEGDRTHRAEDTRNTFGYAGQGIRIGVISDSYNALNGASADIASGNLPGPGNPYGNTIPVTVLADDTSGTDEGRAMLQIVHDIAPKAQLFFATADISEASFAANIIALHNPPYNCDVIIDDVSYYDEPVFQDGFIAKAVDTVTMDGTLYFSSAGNAGSVAKSSAGYYEGDFNSTGSPNLNLTKTKTGVTHNFGTSSSAISGDIITAVGKIYTLTWADPQGKSSNDYDLFLISSTGKVKASSTNIQNGFQNPIEAIPPPALATGDRLVVFKTSSAAKRAFAINTNRGTLTVVTTGQTHAHACAVNAFCVAATPAVAPGPYPAVFNNTNTVESFSSDGPRRMFYNGDGTAITANNFLFATSGGTVRNKPDITAADGVSTTLPSGSGLNPFYGTSAAAPHAGAIAALLKSANPSLSTAQIRTILTSTTLDIEANGYDKNSGYGIIQAYQAMQAVNPLATANILTDTITATEGSFGNGNGNIDPGEMGKLTVQLSNPAALTATNVSGVLTTNTPGVIIINDSAFYGSIPAGSFVTNTTMPFSFGINKSIPCGTTIPFILTVTYSGGTLSSQKFPVNITIGGQPGANITSTIGSPALMGTGFASASGQQTGRLSRGADAASCAAPLTNPGLLLTSGARQYDAYTFVNSDSLSQCVNVTMTSNNGTNLYTASYNDSGFVPANPSLHFLADPGQSTITQQYSFTASPLKAFTVVVNDVNTTPASNSAYKLNVSLCVCAAAPPCTPDTIRLPILMDSIEIAYSQPITATGGSGSYLYSFSADSLPAGLSVSNNLLSGTPTTAGIYPITITTTDATGCPGATITDTLRIFNAVTYIFNGNGNWDIPSNWANNKMPPPAITSNSQIIIDPVADGQCILNIPYTVTPGTTLTVEQGKNFIIQGNLINNNDENNNDKQ